MSDDFKARLLSHAQAVLDRAGRATSEAATQQYLVLPFFQLLGYDPLNPDEVIPEAHASFSDKFKNRVDYAICKDHEPVIAVECKRAGTIGEGHRGELKGYFNAVSTVKLGILTDGIVYELYSDTGAENMMDDEPFVRVDLSVVAREGIDENALDALLKLRKGTFDPADVGADARRKIFIEGYVNALDTNFREPGEPLVKALMDLVGVEGRRTGRLVDEHTPIVAQAIQVFLDKKILERVGFADRQDLVRMQTAAAPVVAPPASENGESVVPSRAFEESGVITTETERAIFEYVKNRLSFLVEDEEQFERLHQLSWIDRKTLFTVFYKQERKGRLFNFREGKEPLYRFEFPDLSQTVETNNLKEIDEPLLVMFRRRIQELG